MSDRYRSEAHGKCSNKRSRTIPVRHTLLWRHGGDLGKFRCYVVVDEAFPGILNFVFSLTSASGNVHGADQDLLHFCLAHGVAEVVDKHRQVVAHLRQRACADGHRGDLFLERDGADAFLDKILVLDTSYFRSRMKVSIRS